MKVVAIEGKKEGKESDDEIGGKLVGSALWRLTPGKTEEEWDREDRGGSVECGEKMSPRPEVFNEIERGLQAVRRRVRRDQMFWGEFIHSCAWRTDEDEITKLNYLLPAELIHLDTHPDYQRRGIGSMLVQWGVDKSNESGIPAYLESTEIGSPLYMKFGFKEVDRLTLAMSKWAEFGGQGSYSYVYMVRWPDSQELN